MARPRHRSRLAASCATTLAIAVTLGGSYLTTAAASATVLPGTAAAAGSAGGQTGDARSVDGPSAADLAAAGAKNRRRDPDPHTPVPAAAQAKAAAKDATDASFPDGVVIGGGGPLPAASTAQLAATSLDVASGVTGAATTRSLTTAAAAANPPAQVVLGYAQQPQQASYYCGPAAVAQALALLGIYRTQNEIATRLRTNVSGHQTSWSGTFTWYYAPDVGSTRRPVADVMGSYMYGWGRTGRYYSADVPETPTAADIALYEKRLVADASTGYPLLGDAWEVQGAGNLRLPGHPAVFPHTSYDVFHWYTVHGYENSGATTYVTDPAAGSPYVSWSSTIPRYSKVASATLTVINGGRGYVW